MVIFQEDEVEGGEGRSAAATPAGDGQEGAAGEEGAAAAAGGGEGEEGAGEKVTDLLSRLTPAEVKSIMNSVMEEMVQGLQVCYKNTSLRLVIHAWKLFYASRDIQFYCEIALVLAFGYKLVQYESWAAKMCLYRFLFFYEVAVDLWSNDITMEQSFPYIQSLVKAS